MTNRFSVHAVVLFLATTGAAPAIALPATAEGAAAITSALQTYVGSKPGVVTAKPQGDTYELTPDLSPFADAADTIGATVTLSPFVMHVTDNGDGTWGIAQDQSLSFAMSVPGEIDMTMSVGSLTYSGTYDTSLGATLTQTGEMTDLRLTQSVATAGAPAMQVFYSADRFYLDGQSSAGSSGGVDGTIHSEMTGCLTK